MEARATKATGCTAGPVRPISCLSERDSFESQRVSLAATTLCLLYSREGEKQISRDESGAHEGEAAVRPVNLVKCFITRRRPLAEETRARRSDETMSERS